MTYIQWLGTGSCTNAELGGSAFAIDGERTLLVNCGDRILQATKERGLFGKITDVAITGAQEVHVGQLREFGIRYKGVMQYRPRLYIPDQTVADRLRDWGLHRAKLEELFEPQVTQQLYCPGTSWLVTFCQSPVPLSHNYAIQIGDAFFSGTSAVMRTNARHIFQSCRLPEDPDSEVPGYEFLHRHFPKDIRRRMHLVNLGYNWQEYNAKKDGFAGFVMPGEKFEVGE